jgi:hypothetical protein
LREYAIKTAIEKSAVVKDGVCFVAEENVCPYVFEKDGKTYILLVNFSDDDYPAVHLTAWEDYKKIHVITPKKPREKVVSFKKNGGMYALKCKIPAGSSVLLVFEKK